MSNVAQCATRLMIGSCYLLLLCYNQIQETGSAALTKYDKKGGIQNESECSGYGQYR